MNKLGLEIRKKNLFKQNVYELKKLLRNHGVLIFKNQNINNKKLVMFAKLLANQSFTIFLINFKSTPR